MGEICTDDRFELIQKYKEKLIQGTNIETSKEEMNVIDNILFRFWQMGWLEALEKQIPKVAEHEDGVWSICPCCGGSVCNDTEHAVNGEVSYCEHCGQAIDWENSTFD